MIKRQTDYDQMYMQIINMYRKQRAFDGARLTLAQWRLSRKLAKGVIK